MAYDLANSEDFAKQMKREADIERSSQLSDAEYTAQFKRLLGGK